MVGNAVGGAEACVKPSRTKASSYAGLQAAAAAVGGAEEGRGLLLHRSENKTKHVKCKLIKNVINNTSLTAQPFYFFFSMNFPTTENIKLKKICYMYIR